MPLNLRTPGSDQGSTRPAHTYPVSRSLALTVLAALVLLFALRHLFGAVHAEVGVK
jgi:hypothetical protein